MATKLRRINEDLNISNNSISNNTYLSTSTFVSKNTTGGADTTDVRLQISFWDAGQNFICAIEPSSDGYVTLPEASVEEVYTKLEKVRIPKQGESLADIVAINSGLSVKSYSDFSGYTTNYTNVEFTATGNIITDNSSIANGFSKVRVGDTIHITNTASNNSTFSVSAVNTSTTPYTITVNEAITTEASGSVTIVHRVNSDIYNSTTLTQSAVYIGLDLAWGSTPTNTELSMNKSVLNRGPRVAPYSRGDSPSGTELNKGIYIPVMTNSSQSFQTEADGTGATLPDPAGALRVYKDNQEVTSEFTFSVNGGLSQNKNGLVFTIDDTAGPTYGQYGLSGTWATVSDEETFDVLYTNIIDNTIQFTLTFSATKARKGAAGVSGFLTNDSVQVPANNDGSGADITGVTSQFKLIDGITDVTASGTYTIESTNPVQGVTAAINGSTGAITFSGTWNNASDSISFTFRGEYSGVQIDKTLNLTKAKAGADSTAQGSSGVAVSLSLNDQVFSYDEFGDNPTPATTTVTAVDFGITGTAYYNFIVDGVSQQHTTTNTYTYTPQADYLNMPENINVELREDGTGTTLLATDTIAVFGVSENANSPTVVLSNATHTIPVDKSGTETYTGSGTDITAYIGNTQLTYSGSGANTFSVSPAGTNITVGGASTVSGNIRRLADASSMTADTAYIDYTITLRGSGGNTYATIVRRQTFSKSFDGTDASSVELSATSQTISYDGDGANPSPSSSITFTATPKNPPASPYYQFLGTGINEGTLGDDTATYSIPASYTGTPITFTVNMRETDVVGTIVASDTITISELKAGADVYNIILSNEAHTVPSDNDGSNPVLTGSGTNISVFKGTTELDSVTTVPGTGEFRVSGVVPTGGIVAPTITVAGNPAVQPDYTAMTSDSGTVTFTIELESVSNTTTKVQTLSKSKQGGTGGPGPDGQSTKTVNIYKIDDTTLASTTEGTYADPLPSGGSNDSEGWSLTPSNPANGQTLYQFSRLFTSDAQSPQQASWQGPYVASIRVDGNTGPRGAGLFYYETATFNGSNWSTVEAAAVAAVIPDGTPVTDDVLTITDTAPVAFSESRIYNGSAWVAFSTKFDGDVLVDGTLAAGKIVANSISSGQIQAGGITADRIGAGAITTATLTADNLTSGTIDASVITVNNLNANNITAGTLNADRIAADSIDGTKLTADSIDGKVITGATIQTAPSSDTTDVVRITNIPNQSIEVWDASGNKAIYAQNGSVYFNGTLAGNTVTTNSLSQEVLDLIDDAAGSGAPPSSGGNFSADGSKLSYYSGVADGIASAGTTFYPTASNPVADQQVGALEINTADTTKDDVTIEVDFSDGYNSAGNTTYSNPVWQIELYRTATNLTAGTLINTWTTSNGNSGYSSELDISYFNVSGTFSYTDSNVPNGTYYYYLKLRWQSGSSTGPIVGYSPQVTKFTISAPTVGGTGVSDLPDLGDVTLGSVANGDILYNNGSAWVNLAAGTNGQVLKLSGGIPSWGTDNNTTYSVGDGGLTEINFTTARRDKLNGIATGAEVNQNAFSNIAVSGQTTVAADGKTDTFTLAAGSNITITTNATSDTVTIAASGVGDPNQNAFTTIQTSGNTTGDTTIVADSATDTLNLVGGGSVTLIGSASGDQITISGTNTTYSGGYGIGLSSTTFSLESSELTEITSFDHTGGTITTEDSLVVHDITDGDPKRILAGNIPLTAFNNDLTLGDPNQTITTGTGLDGADAGSSGNITISLDLSELTDMTAAVDRTQDELIILDNGAQRRKLISEIDLSDFNDDIGATGAGSMDSWDLTADSGTTATIGNGGLVDIAGGTGIDTSIASNTVTVDLNFADTDLHKLRDWEPAYSNTNEDTIFWDSTEEAVALQNSSAPDTTVGMSHKAFRVSSGEQVHLSLTVKGSAADTDGVYFRVYYYNGDLPDGKTHVSNSGGVALVQEDSNGNGGSGIGVTSWHENSSINTSWTNYEFTWTVPDLSAAGGSAVDHAYASIVILNWTGYAGIIYVKDPKINIQSNHDIIPGFVANEHIDHSSVTLTAGTGLTGGGDLTANRTFALDFSELTDMTANISGTTEFILQNGTVESRKAASEIQLSHFSNNLGWTDNTGTVTSVSGGNGLTGTVTTSGSLAVGAGTGISVAADTVDIASTYSPGTATEMGATQNLDDLNAAQAGFYYQTANADTTGNNYPSGEAGSLIVQKSAGNATQMYQSYTTSPKLHFRSRYTGSWGTWQRVFADNYHPNADTLTTARTINGTSFNGSANITTANWGTSRTLTIGNTGKSVNGSGNVSWSIAEIGAQAAGNYLLDTTDTFTGTLTMAGTIDSTAAQDTNILQWDTTGRLRRMTDQGGINLSCDSSILLHAGDNHTNLETELGITNATTGENIYLTADSDVVVITGRQDGVYPTVTDEWTFANGGTLTCPGTVTAPTFSGSLSGNATTASAWATGRTITLTGDVTGTSAAWTGSGNISITTTVGNDSHTHDNIVSQGDLAAETLRAVHDTGIYTYNTNNSSLGNSTPTSYWSTLAWGQGTGGSAQLAANWTSNGDQLWYRSLRDTIDNWWAWKRIFTDNYHPNADTWTTGRTITLTGDVTGTSAAWDGSGNISFSTAVGNDTHTHAFNNLTGKTSGTGNYQTSGDFIADNFEATGLGPNTDPGTDDAYFGGYGILGSRNAGNPFYVSNVTGGVYLNHAGVHNQNTKLATTATGVTVTGEGTATDWIGTSDARLKRNIQPLTNGLETVLNLEAVTHEWIDGKPGRYNGFIAQQVKEVDPSLVTENEEGIFAVNYMKAVPVLVNAIQQLNARDEARESKLKDLEDKLDRLFERLG